jgi:hypothetical protein
MPFITFGCLVGLAITLFILWKNLN